MSKKLSYLLRHGAIKEGLNITDDGFVSIKDLILFAPELNEAIIKQIARDDCKQRFYIKDDCIRANQGHSLDVNVELEVITDPSVIPVVIHGTLKSKWSSIQSTGLHRMKRKYIHFAEGMRKSCDLFIYIDTERCMKDGIVFYRSANNVILSSGIDGTIDSKYFKFVKKI